ncbi:MAG TPA: hypothetical protein VFD36_10435 [Kofleriaceae bacterium]|nr:hypothetical protein [Kofleriaceae bacterium]
MVLVIATGCRTAAEKDARRLSAVDVAPLGDDTFAIRSDVGATEGASYQYAYRRAAQACPSGFGLVDQKSTAVTSWKWSMFGASRSDRPEVMIMVRCKPPRAEPEPTQGETSEPPSTGWWCHAGHSTCFRDRDECARRHAQGVAGCEPREQAWCAGAECYGGLAVCQLDESTGKLTRDCTAVQ